MNPYQTLGHHTGYGIEEQENYNKVAGQSVSKSVEKIDPSRQILLKNQFRQSTTNVDFNITNTVAVFTQDGLTVEMSAPDVRRMTKAQLDASLDVQFQAARQHKNNLEFAKFAKETGLTLK